MGRNQTARKSPKKALNPRPVRAVFFDAGNTLLRAHPSVGHIYTRAARRHGLRLPVAWVEERFQAAWRDRHRHALPKNDNAEKLWWRKMVRRVFGARFAPRAFDTFFNDLYGRFAHPRHWRLFDDALPTLRALRRRGFRLGIVSNWDSRLVTLSEKIGLTREVEFLLVSSLEGVAKPDPTIFERALARAGVAPHEALHVGDSLREDYLGARAAGLSALLLERHGPGPQGISTIRSLEAVVPHAETFGRSVRRENR
ncbi:MAG TPA: HAD-IA family hydrolase [Elusimicrobiota bacterium]|nr:HAD-IA family hydrolase [Elusimicrobiota bacterium]HNI56185.1 HAD-IA family hydrolase [Elusimicrobiota bacterium]